MTKFPKKNAYKPFKQRNPSCIHKISVRTLLCYYDFFSISAEEEICFPPTHQIHLRDNYPNLFCPTLHRLNFSQFWGEVLQGADS